MDSQGEGAAMIGIGKKYRKSKHLHICPERKTCPVDCKHKTLHMKTPGCLAGCEHMPEVQCARAAAFICPNREKCSRRPCIHSEAHSNLASCVVGCEVGDFVCVEILN